MLLLFLFSPAEVVLLLLKGVMGDLVCACSCQRPVVYRVLSLMEFDEVMEKWINFLPQDFARNLGGRAAVALNVLMTLLVSERTVSIFLAWVFREVLRYVGYTSRSSGVQWDGE